MHLRIKKGTLCRVGGFEESNEKLKHEIGRLKLDLKDVTKENCALKDENKALKVSMLTEESN